MKKSILLLLFTCIAFYANAQFYGGFYHADPDAWVDKEPYFACRNNFVYNGWGQNIQNVTAVVNGSDVYSFPYVWAFGSVITIGEDNGIKFSSGDTVSLYWGNQCIGTWTYKPSSALAEIKFRGVKGAGKIIKTAWRYVKRIR